MSYAQPDDHTAAVVAALAELGVRAGDRVLIMLSDGPASPRLSLARSRTER
jgi:acyl-coenzyme A synthetase/AMP-(fatty) acid ligase